LLQNIFDVQSHLFESPNSIQGKVIICQEKSKFKLISTFEVIHQLDNLFNSFCFVMS